MAEGENETTYQQPGFAAEQVGVSASGLRRLASIYAEVHGELPRDSADNRLWPTEAVERLKAARALVKSGRARSTKEALEAVLRGVDVPAEALEVVTPTEGALEVLIQEIRAMRGEIIALRGENGEIKQQLKALEPPKAVASDDGKEAGKLGELLRINSYLKGELDRRDKEKVAEVGRPWWKWWA